MKTLINLFFGIFVVCALQAQDTTGMVNKTCSPEFKPELKSIEGFNLLYYEYTGPYDQAFNNFQSLMDFMAQNNIEFGKCAVGVYYDDPEQVAADKLRSEAGYATKNAVDNPGSFKFKKVEPLKAVCVKYSSMEDIMKAYTAIYEFITKNGLTPLGPSYEFYYGMDGTDSEIIFPVAQ